MASAGRSRAFDSDPPTGSGRARGSPQRAIGRSSLRTRSDVEAAGGGLETRGC